MGETNRQSGGPFWKTEGVGEEEEENKEGWRDKQTHRKCQRDLI